MPDVDSVRMSEAQFVESKSLPAVPHGVAVVPGALFVQVFGSVLVEQSVERAVW